MTPVPAGPYYPTNALVAVAWLSRRVTGLNASMVATKLPRDSDAWADLGFVQATVIAGTPEIYLGTRHPYVQVDAWATSPSSVKPPVGKANRLAELILRATENDAQTFSAELDLGENYMAVRVLSVYPLTEPSPIQDDPSGYARVTFDLMIDWVRA